MEFSRQEYGSGLPFPSPGGVFLTQGLNPGLLHCRQILYRRSHQGIYEGVVNDSAPQSKIAVRIKWCDVESLSTALAHNKYSVSFYCYHGCISDVVNRLQSFHLFLIWYGFKSLYQPVQLLRASLSGFLLKSATQCWAKAVPWGAKGRDSKWCSLKLHEQFWWWHHVLSCLPYAAKGRFPHLHWTPSH